MERVSNGRHIGHMEFCDPINHRPVMEKRGIGSFPRETISA